MVPPSSELSKHIAIFEPMLEISFSMIPQVVGPDTNIFVTRAIPGLLVSLHHSSEAYTQFNFPQFLSDEIYSQMIEFEEMESFHYQTYFVHLFIHQQYPYLSI